MKNALIGLLALLMSASWSTADEKGGPLAGKKPTLFPTQHGEAPGYPGCIPELMAKGETFSDLGNIYRDWGPQGQFPQYQLYPGSVENMRFYWLKYVPARSMFDADTLLENWRAPSIPGADKTHVESLATPIYWVPRHSQPKATGKFNKPVPVVRCSVKAPVFNLPLGELEQGMYVVRVIAAIEPKHLATHLKPIYVAMTVNDGIDGKENTYRLRIGFNDEFYSVAELYFHANTKRSYTAKVWVDEGSTIDLLVHNIDVHDVLAGTERRAIKKKMCMTTPEERQRLRKGKRATEITDMTKRFSEDKTLWDTLPPLNTQIGGIYGPYWGYSKLVKLGAKGKTLKELEQEFGKWERARSGSVLLTNKKLGLRYTMADLAALKPLPDPYPIKDRGAGVVTPQAGKPQQEFAVVADAATARFNWYYLSMRDRAWRYHAHADTNAGWSAAMQLCRVAWVFPALDGSQSLGCLVTDPGGFGHPYRTRKRGPHRPVGGGNGVGYADFPAIYDRVFDLINGNEDFARSVARFVPWVKNADDVVKLLDVYLMQIKAKRILRYNYIYDNRPTWIVLPATVLGDRSVTNPWMEWLFTQAFIYPNPPSGLSDMIVSGNGRDGIGYIGSWMYGSHEQAAQNGIRLADYIKSGGAPQYDVTDRRLFPKVVNAAYWMSFRSRLAGLHAPRIGDVGGPDKEYGFLFKNSIKIARDGWRWTKDPAFAYIIKHHLGRKQESNSEWRAIETAAATLKRAPWLDNKSRVLPNWFGALETGLQYDDPRLRRSAMVRIGQGYGHHHHDTLDLQITAHGLPMTIDGGQRPAYSKPVDRTTRIHNVVEVDGEEWVGHSWVRSLSDAKGARYLQAEAVPPTNLKQVESRRRQVAMIDVDADTNSYVFDVARVSGGKQHTYCFHGPLEDELVTNVTNRKPYEELPKDEQDYVKMFRNAPIKGYPTGPLRYGGDAPAVLEATWRMALTIPGNGKGEREIAPWKGGQRKYTKLHLFCPKGKATGVRAMTGWAWCRQWSYGYNVIMAQRKSPAATDVVFPALIEPYAGTPFITNRRLLSIPRNETDAAQAVAVEVKTKNGHTDLCFADGRPKKVRNVGGAKVAAEFAYVSRDAKGLRQATITGGTQLSAPDFVLAPAKRERVAKVTAVDYKNSRISIDQAWPVGAVSEDATFEIGVPGRMTTVTIKKVSASDKGSIISTLRGADLYQSGVLAVDSAKREVACTLGMPHRAGVVCPGLDKHLVVSNRDRTRFWRAQYIGRTGPEKKYIFKLDGPVKLADFGKSERLRVWEYGVGDTVRQTTHASVRRTTNGWELGANVSCKVALPAAKAPNGFEISIDRASWKPLKTRKQLALWTFELNEKQFRSGTVWLRAARK